MLEATLLIGCLVMLNYQAFKALKNDQEKEDE